MGHLTVFHPTDLSIEDFYMSYDIKLFIDTVKVQKGTSHFNVQIVSVQSSFAVNNDISEQLLEFVWQADSYPSLEGQPVQVSILCDLIFCCYLNGIAIFLLLLQRRVLQ